MWLSTPTQGVQTFASSAPVTTARRAEASATAFWPPHPAVRDNLEAFARAAAGGPAYPVTPEEMLANARTFEAIVRSAASGRIERV